MSQGWFKLHRELFEKAIWQESTPEQKVILITLLGMANHQGKEWEWKGKQFKAAPGQFITSSKSIISRCGKGITEQKLRTALKKFERYGFLTDETTKVNRLITIVNWGVYQGGEYKTNEPFNEHLTNNQQTSNEPLTDHQQTPNEHLTTNKNDKNDKNVKNDKNGEEGKEDIERDIDKSKINWNNILESWNSLPDTINKIRTISGTRRDKVKTRMKNLELKEADILKAIEKIKESDFLQGKNDRNWTIKFDWLFKNDVNIMKVLEGNYDNKELIKSKYEDGIKKDNFNSYEQRDYDFDALERKLLGWDKEE